MIDLSTGTNSMKWKEKGKITIYDVKSWPYDRWLKLAVRLANSGFMVVLIGGIKERNEDPEINFYGFGKDRMY